MKKLKLRFLVFKINFILKSFLKKNKFNCNIEFDEDFAYYIMKDSKPLICWNPIIDKIGGFGLTNQFHKFGLKKDFGFFILCFLHELGHLNTIPNFSQKEIEEYNERSKIRRQDLEEYENTDEYIAEVNEDYYTEKIEQTATQWASNYINNNELKISNLNKKLSPLLLSLFDTMES